jgi:ribosomal protein L37AE/L43A
MPTQLETKTERGAREETAKGETAPTRTVIGWQGVRFTLPPEWNVTGFSMDRENGYLRVDSPGNGTMTVQIRWTNAAKPDQGGPSLYGLVAPTFRKMLRRPEPPVPPTDLKANLEKILKETAKQAKRARSAFESSIKSEKIEGENGERSAINFSWSGVGRGQGKIWRCHECNRVVVAQVVGMAKDHTAMSAVASQLFATLHDHARNGHDLWALYDLQVEIPQDFQLEEQKLLSGYLHLAFGRSGEKIVLDRWGLANITLKKFRLEEWFRNHALVGLKRLAHEEIETGWGHAAHAYAGSIPLLGLLRSLRDARGSLRRFPTRYEGGIWECPESNKLYAVQVVRHRRTQGLWAEVMGSVLCHGTGGKSE